MSAPLIISAWMDGDAAHVRLAVEQVYLSISSGRLELGMTRLDAEIFRDALTLMLAKQRSTE